MNRPSRQDAIVPFGEYLITRRIARGGMAEIYRARSPSKRWLALKLMRTSLGHDELRQQLFEREAYISTLLQHPNIVPVFDFGEVHDTPYLAMEYVRGRNLSHLLSKSRGHIEPALAIWICRSAAQGLGHAHRLCDADGTPLEIVHRDVSPGNIMLGYDGAVKVLDFGVARINASSSSVETQRGVLRGKFAYMSPEQTLGKDIDPRSDVFSLGTLLYELITGEHCFRADDAMTTLQRVQSYRPPPPTSSIPYIPRSVDQVLARCMAKEPERRFADGIELAEALAHLLSEWDFTGRPEIAAQMQKHFEKQAFEENTQLQDEERRASTYVVTPENAAQSLDLIDTALGDSAEGVQVVASLLGGNSSLGSIVEPEPLTTRLDTSPQKEEDVNEPETYSGVDLRTVPLSVLAPLSSTKESKIYPAVTSSIESYASIDVPKEPWTNSHSDISEDVLETLPPLRKSDDVTAKQAINSSPSKQQRYAVNSIAGAALRNVIFLAIVWGVLTASIATGWFLIPYITQSSTNRLWSEENKTRLNPITINVSPPSRSIKPSTVDIPPSNTTKAVAIVLPTPHGPKSSAIVARTSTSGASTNEHSSLTTLSTSTFEAAALAKDFVVNLSTYPGPFQESPPPLRRSLTTRGRPKAKRFRSRFGYLSVFALPSSRIVINGKLWPHPTPQSAIKLKPGSYAIEVVDPKSGRRISRNVRVRRGAKTRINIDLRHGDSSN